MGNTTDNGHCETMLNFYALVVSIITDKSCNDALAAMGIDNKPGVDLKQPEIVGRDKEILRRFFAGEKPMEISERMGVNTKTVYKVIQRKKYLYERAVAKQ
jgi:hypothetical protein